MTGRYKKNTWRWASMKLHFPSDKTSLEMVARYGEANPFTIGTCWYLVPHLQVGFRLKRPSWFAFFGQLQLVYGQKKRYDSFFKRPFWSCYKARFSAPGHQLVLSFLALWILPWKNGSHITGAWGRAAVWRTRRAKQCLLRLRRWFAAGGRWTKSSMPRDESFEVWWRAGVKTDSSSYPLVN